MYGLGLSDLWFVPSVVTRAPVPRDLESVQTIDADAEIDPREVGVDPAAVDAIWAAAQRWYGTGIHPAISVCVRVRGQIVLKRAIGHAAGAGPQDGDDAPKVLATPETPFNAYSASKPMAAMVIHLLDQRHQLHLDDPICEYIPDFARHGKESVTIRHVLTHRAGIPTLPEEALDLSLLEDVTNRNAVSLLCDARPVSRAGGRLAYHAITGGFLLGEIVRCVTGKNIRTVIDEELCKPLGWRWMNYGVKRRDIGKTARNYFTGFPLVPPLRSILHGVLGTDFEQAIDASNDPRFVMGVLPSANLFGTADEMSQFYQLLLDGGELGGVRVFEPRTVWRATAEQSYGELDFTLGVPLRYGMGFMLGGDWLSLYGLDTRYAFGHLGFTNIVTWADPQRHLAAAVMTSGKPAIYPEMYQAFAFTNAITAACPKDDAVPPTPHVETGRPRAKRAVQKPRVAATPSSKGRSGKPRASAAPVVKAPRAKSGAARPARKAGAVTRKRRPETTRR